MSQTGKKNLVITSIALYFTYFIHGIGASIMGQYKPELAAHWGAKALSDGTMDVSMVVSVIGAVQRQTRPDLRHDAQSRAGLHLFDGDDL